MQTTNEDETNKELKNSIPPDELQLRTSLTDVEEGDENNLLHTSHSLSQSSGKLNHVDRKDRTYYKLHPSNIALRTQLLVTSESKRMQDKDEEDTQLIDKLIPPTTVPAKVIVPSHQKRFTLLGYDFVNVCNSDEANKHKTRPTIFPSHLYSLPDDKQGRTNGDSSSSSGDVNARQRSSDNQLNLRSGSYLLYRNPISTLNADINSRDSQVLVHAKRLFYVFLVLDFFLFCYITFAHAFVEKGTLISFENKSLTRMVIIEPLQLMIMMFVNIIGFIGAWREWVRYLTTFIIIIHVFFVIEMVAFFSLMSFLRLSSYGILLGIAFYIRSRILPLWFSTPSL